MRMMFRSGWGKNRYGHRVPHLFVKKGFFGRWKEVEELHSSLSNPSFEDEFSAACKNYVAEQQRLNTRLEYDPVDDQLLPPTTPFLPWRRQ